MTFRSLHGAIPTGGNPPPRGFSVERARDRSNADRDAAAAFDVQETARPTLRQGLLIVLRRDDRARAYTVFLFDDHADVKPAVRASMTTLRFR